LGALQLVATRIQFVIGYDASGSTSPAKETEFAVEIVQTTIAIATIAMADNMTTDFVNYSAH
jgi:hypothetical protein